jgi:hypothetical protein
MSQPRRRRTDLSLIPSSQAAKPEAAAGAGNEPSAATAYCPVPEERAAMIAAAAYFRAERRNFCPGCELEDWLAAEQEVDQMLAAAAAMPLAPSAA